MMGVMVGCCISWLFGDRCLVVVVGLLVMVMC